MSAAALTVGTPYGSRGHPALGRSFALSATVHLMLVGVMFFGVRFTNSPPAVVNVELWEAPAPVPQPVVEEPKPQPPVVKPQPEPEPEVKKTPEIALPEKPKPKPKPKPVPKRDLAFEKQLRDQAAQEERRVQDQLIRDQAARASADIRSRELARWTDKIRAKIRGNIILPQDIPGNPEAIFDVILLPTGEVLSTHKKQSSGHLGYDDAVDRAIMKSSPLPKPDDPSLFQRQLQLKFRPKDR